MPYYSIQAAAQISGISDACIRAWEKRYNSITPTRNVSNHRQYSEKDIERLTLFNKLTSIGMRISQLSNLETEELEKIYLSVTKKKFNQGELAAKNSSVTFFQSLYIIEESFNAGRFDVAYHEIKKVIDLSDVKDLALKFFPALEGICQNWKDKKIIEELKIHAFERYTQNLSSLRAHRERQLLRDVKTMTVSLESNKNRIGDSSLELLLIAHRVDDSLFSNETKTDFIASLAEVIQPEMIFIVGEMSNDEVTNIVAQLSENSNAKVIVYDQKVSLLKTKTKDITPNTYVFNSILEIDKFLEEAL
jgi:hypothetical protein